MSARKRRAWLRGRELQARLRHRVDPPASEDGPKRARIKEPHEPLPFGARASYYRAQNGRYVLTPRQERRIGKKARRRNRGES